MSAFARWWLVARWGVILVICAAAAPAAASSHTRLRTSQGPVHVWKPTGYDRATAGIVVYVHGYYTTVDRAWREHRLARQFAASGINAMFIACEAPSDARDDVQWTSLGALLAEVGDRLDEPMPEGRIVAVGHSGAHRTLSEWLGEGLVQTVVMLDAMLGDKPELRAWLEADADHRLIDAAALSRPWSEALYATLPDVLVFDRFPSRRVGELRGARDARVVYVRSQLDHMGLVTAGVALPMLLRALDLPQRGT